MGLRRVIKFGRSSYVLSLPSSWISRNKIVKGDFLEVIEEPGTLIIEAKTADHVENKKEITIFIKDEKEIKAKIVSIYVNNYDIIQIVSPNIAKYSKIIRDLIRSFMGLEVVEETEKKIIIQDFFDIKNINIHETMQRFNRTLKMMMEDSIAFMQGKDTYDLIFNKEEDLNRLTFMLFKVLKKALRPKNMEILKLSPQEIIRNWEAVLFIERVGDEIKRIVRDAVELKNNVKLIELMQMVYDQYNNAMTAYFKNDIELALIVTLNKRKIPEKADALLSMLNDKQYAKIISKIIAIHSYSRTLANCVLRFESD